MKSSYQLRKFFEKTCPYRIIQVPDIDLDFPLIQLEFDDFGRFLCLLGLRRIWIVDLRSKWCPRSTTKSITNKSVARPSLCSFSAPTSWSGRPSLTTSNVSTSSTSSKKKFPIQRYKGYELGLDDLGLGQCHFLQCAWSPHGIGSGTLMVLSEDGLLRIYELDASSEMPRVTYSFLNTHLYEERQNKWSPHEDACQITSFCLGASFLSISSPIDQVWQPFTVYGVMRNGDVYALCPVMPSECVVDIMTWEAMQASVEYVPSDSPNRTIFEDFLIYLKDHCTFQQDTVRLQTPVIKAYTLSPQPVVVEGPLSLSLDALDVDASDILCLPSSLLLVSYKNGHIDIFAFDVIVPEFGPWIQISQPDPSVFSFCASMALQTISCFLIQTLDLETNGELRFLRAPVPLPSSADLDSIPPHSPLLHASSLGPPKNLNNEEPLEDEDLLSSTYLVHAFHSKGVHQCYLSLSPSPNFHVFQVLHTVPMTNALLNPIVGCQFVLDHLLNPTMVAQTFDDVFAVLLYPFDLDTQLLALSTAQSPSPSTSTSSTLASLTAPPPPLQTTTLVVPSLISIRSGGDALTWTPQLMTYLHSVYHQVAIYLHQLNQFSLDVRAYMHWQRHTMTFTRHMLVQLPTQMTQPPEVSSMDSYKPRVAVYLKKVDVLLQWAYDHVHADRLSEREQQFFNLVCEMTQEMQSLKQRSQKLLRLKDTYIKQKMAPGQRGSENQYPQCEWSKAQASQLERALYKQYQELNSLQTALQSLQPQE
ncbi:hypothetical protein HMI55_005201 [Coelomomyces lativittatus]|nr:hypothetical protein HMI55_005201 [Coelomomyces lativittatus]